MTGQSVTFILCETRFASNLGSSARVLNNFGFSRLILVRPQCDVGAEARTYAMEGASLLDSALLFPDLEAAASKVDFLIGTSARSFRRGPINITSDRILPDVLAPNFPRRMGIAFGSEKNGLDRKQLALCHWLLNIPTRVPGSSLNLAQAVAIVAYQLQLADPGRGSEEDSKGASPAHWNALLREIRNLLERADLPTTLSRDRILKRIARIGGRAQLDRPDIDLLLGLIRRLK